MRKIALLAAVAAAFALPAMGAAASGATEFTFTKHFDLAKTMATGVPTWSGTIGGDLNGTLETRFIAAESWSAGPVDHIVFDWTIWTADGASDVRMKGIFDTRTGRVVMNGVVTRGPFAGARVHEQAQPIDAFGGYAGTGHITPTGD